VDEGERNLEARILNGDPQCAALEDVESKLIYEEGRFTFQAWNALQKAQFQCVELVEAQDSLPWIETFDHQDGTKSHDGSTFWTTSWTAGAAASGTWEVQNGALKFNSAGFEGVLQTTIINIAGQTPVAISLDLHSVASSGALEATGDDMDYVRLYTKVDGGSKVLLGEILGDQGTSITGSITAGSELKVIVEAYVSSDAESYYLENLSIGV